MSLLQGFCLVVAVAVSSPALGQAPPGTEPVPASQLNGTRFFGLDPAFSVDAPGPDWQWLRVADERIKSAIRTDIEQQTYIVYEAKQRRGFSFQIMEVPNICCATNEEFMRAFQNGVERSMPQVLGLTAQQFHFAPSDIPIKGSSYRYTAKATRADGAVLYQHGYVGGSGKKKFVFGYIDPSEQEAAEFSSFVRSFVIEPVK